MRHKHFAANMGLALVLGFLVGSVALTVPAQAVAGCAVLEQGSGTGEVVTCCDGQGFVVKIDGELVKLVGLGPVWFWEANGYDRPQIKDEVTVWWNVVRCGSVEQNVLVALDYVNDNITAALELRNENNVPLWNVAKRQIMRQQQLANQHRNGQTE